MKRSAIPAELKALSQWVCWKLVHNPKKPKPDKLPVDLRTGNLASVIDANTWTDFAVAVQHLKANGCTGIGFVLTADDPYCVIDLDGCRNPETGEIAPWAQAIITRFNTRTEISPSGTGVHLILKGNLPGPRCRTGSIEMYDHARYITMTARVADDM